MYHSKLEENRDIQMILKRIKPLFYNSKGVLIVSKGEKILSFDGNNFTYLFSLPTNKTSKFLSFFKLWARLTRFDVLTAVEYLDAYYFVFNYSIYRYDQVSRTLTVDLNFIPGRGRGPLSLSVIKNLEGFNDGIYFGEYIANKNKNPVNVYHRSKTWKIIHTFPQGEINHIHAIVSDPLRKQLWLLTGDTDDSAAMYRTSNNFKTVTKVVGGNQKYRSCVAFPTSSGLLYATDSHIELNSIRLLRQDNNTWVSEKISNLNGSCIYGCETPDYYVFSTSTEPSARTSNLIASLLNNKPSPAIIENRSTIMVSHKKRLEFKEVFSIDKDIYPYRLFQFGAIKFPAGKALNNTIYAYSVGGKTLDLSTKKINL